MDQKLDISKYVRLDDDFSNDQVLVCPRCHQHGEYLHHGRVTVYDRNEDDEYITKTEVASSDPCFTEPHPQTTVTTVKSIGSGNPSSRRHGIAIQFCCERCLSSDIELTIEQHKGVTTMAWRVKP